MRKLSGDELRKLQLDLLDAFDRLCREHGIDYCLAYGSALGAARHGGFIPWDDDIDVHVMREDYELLLAHYDEWQHEPHHKLKSYRDGISTYQYAKLVDVRTRAKELYSTEKDGPGVWIDLFPIDFVPKHARKVYGKHRRLKFARDMSLADTSYALSPLALVAKKIIAPLFKRVDPRKIARLIDENAMNCEKGDKSRCLDIVGTYIYITFPTEMLRPKRMRFEGREYNVPSQLEEYLTLEYGDWRKPLDESERHAHASEVYWLEDNAPGI